jgi:hypothetical protein
MCFPDLAGLDVFSIAIGVVERENDEDAECEDLKTETCKSDIDP